MIQNMKEINQIFKKHTTPLWLNYGTLLGIYRDRKLVDNDIDFATVPLNKPFLRFKYADIILDLERKKYSVYRYNLGLVVEKNGFRAGIGFYDFESSTRTLIQKNLPVFYQEKPLAKKFFYAFMKNNPSNLNHFLFKLLGGYCIILVVPAEFVCPLKRIRFGGTYYYIPNQTEKYLEYLYGPDWKTPDENFPHYVTKQNMKYFDNSYWLFFMKCVRCKSTFLVSKPRMSYPVEKIKVSCPFCHKKWKQKVFVKGTVTGVLKC